MSQPSSRTVPSARPIGIFDSGVGGLTVMKALIERLPTEDMIYLGDTARVPYGNRGPETVRRYATNAAALLRSHDIKALVVACNTASAYALEALRDGLDIPVFGVIAPVARRAAELTETDKIAILGTRGTIQSNSYQRSLLNLRSQIDVYPVACPLLVPLAEEGWTTGSVTEQVIEHYLSPLSGTGVDTMILGCTHYPLMQQTIAEVVERLPFEVVTLVDSARTTSQAVEEALREKSLLSDENAAGVHRFLLTDLPQGFIETAERFFGRSLDGACEHVDITDSTFSLVVPPTG